MSKVCKIIKENAAKLDMSTCRYYLGISTHGKILESINYEHHCAKSAENVWMWYGQAISQLPAGYYAVSFSGCAYFTMASTASRNLVDICINAPVLNDLLPSFLARPPTSDVEDTFVQSYISPALRAVFHTDEHLQVEWANAALSDEVVKYKPDLKVSTQVFNKKVTLVVTEIKPPKNHSSVKSDTVKLCRQMKQCFHDSVWLVFSPLWSVV